jgi:hypothetical protein
MPTADNARLLRTAPSTNPDGLDLTVVEARALSRELFVRTFGIERIDDVPVVHPGVFLDRAERDCEWYVRWRPAPANPGTRDRKSDGYELVVKVPQRAGPEAGGIALNPLRKMLLAKEVDGARLEALVFLARKAGRRIRASTWLIERIEGLNCSDLLQEYLATDLAPPKEGKKETKAEKKLRQTYSAAVKAFQRAFPALEVGDCKGRIDLEFGVRARMMPRSVFSSLKTVKMALNAMLDRIGVRDYRVNFENKDPGRLEKASWTPAEYDRLLAAAEGWRHNPDGTPMMIPGPDGLVQARRKGGWRKPYRRAIEFLTYTASRGGQVFLTRWVGPEVAPAGRPFDGEEERPWLDVRDDCIEFFRDGEERYDGNKKHGANYIPHEFEPTVLAWYEEDMAAGIEWVFHKETGERYGVRLCNWTWRQIFKDAGLPEGKTAHKLKDLAVAWADCAEVRRSLLAAHADTSEKMLELKYGPSVKVDQLELAAEQITQKAWRERGRRRAAKAEKLAEARAAARSAPDAIKAEARRAKERANSAAAYAAEKARAAAGIPPKTATKTATAPPAAAGNVVDIATRRRPPVRRRAGGDGSA